MSAGVPNVRVLADCSQNTRCRLATLGFSAGVDFGRLLAGTPLESFFTHSPFAVLRGIRFERNLRRDDYAPTLSLLREPLGWPAGAMRVQNLRDGFQAGPDRMPARVLATSVLLARIAQNHPEAPRLIDGAVLEGNIGGRVAYFEADGLASRSADGQICIAEVKSFPKVDDRVDAEQLGSALDQSAVYVHLTRGAVDRLGGDADGLVSDRVFLTTPINTGLTPTLSIRRGRPNKASCVPRVPAGFTTC